MRMSKDETVDGILKNGYDYANQCWVIDYMIQNCGHPKNMKCGCYGREHAGERTDHVHNTLLLSELFEGLSDESIANSLDTSVKMVQKLRAELAHEKVLISKNAPTNDKTTL